MNENQTTVNIPLLRKAVEWAEAEAAKPPELCEWEQSVYYLPASHVGELGRSTECGSCYCIAGYVASMEQQLEILSSAAPRIAEERLGLSTYQAAALFHSENTIEDVRRIAEDIAGERL